MTYRLRLARHPSTLGSKHSLLIEDFLGLARQGKKTCLRAMIEMCRDLHHSGMDSQHIKHLGGPFYELKKRASDGGARVYFFRLQNDFVLVRAECKKENRASEKLLSDVADVIEALEAGAAVL